MFIDIEGRPCLVRSENVLQYVNSAGYANDFHAVRNVWATPQILGGAGMFIFTTYATLPLLTSVGSVDGSGEALMLRKAVSEGQEKTTLIRLLGIGDDAEMAGGLANPMVRRMLAGLGDRHRNLRGMTEEYLDLFAGVIAISGIRMRAALELVLEADDYHRYWRYMRYSLALFGAELGDRETVSDSCARFVARHAGAGQRTRTYLAHLFAAYPEHTLACADALFPETRRVVASTLAGELPAGWSTR
ncbi:hypothetical protein [Streptomyces sp. NPDC019890]|uniref:hypothetical protein n=1 Tax=Streptomyces sp. NPDC019890 TaxID=3365064 RepID=UPI0038505F84